MKCPNGSTVKLKKRKNKVKAQKEQNYFQLLYGEVQPNKLDRVQLDDYMVLNGAILQEQKYHSQVEAVQAILVNC